VAALLPAGCSLTLRAPDLNPSLLNAPEFTLPDEWKDPVSLRDLLKGGFTVLVFYRSHSSPFCRSQLGEMSDLYEEFRKLGATVAGISTDDPGSSKGMKENLRLQFHLLSDPRMEVISKYGVAQEGEDVAVPAVFIVDWQRRFAYRHIGSRITDRPRASAVLSALKEYASLHRPPPPPKPKKKPLTRPEDRDVTEKAPPPGP